MPTVYILHILYDVSVLHGVYVVYVVYILDVHRTVYIVYIVYGAYILLYIVYDVCTVYFLYTVYVMYDEYTIVRLVLVLQHNLTPKLQQLCTTCTITDNRHYGSPPPP